MSCLRSLTKEEVISFYTEQIACPKIRKKLSYQVLSVSEGGAGHSDTPTVDATENDATARLITDMTKFKSSLPLFQIFQPFVNPENLKRLGPKTKK